MDQQKKLTSEAFAGQTGKETQTDLDSFFSPGREELERENHTVVRQPIVDLVDNLHASLPACCCYCYCTSSSSSFPALLLSDFCHGLQRHNVRKTTISEELKQRPPKSLLEPIGQDSNPSSSREHNASEICTSSSNPNNYHLHHQFYHRKCRGQFCHRIAAELSSDGRTDARIDLLN